MRCKPQHGMCTFRKNHILAVPQDLTLAVPSLPPRKRCQKKKIRNFHFSFKLTLEYYEI